MILVHFEDKGFLENDRLLRDKGKFDDLEQEWNMPLIRLQAN